MAVEQPPQEGDERVSNRWAFRSAFAVSEAMSWQKRMSASEKEVAPRSVRRKTAPMMFVRHRMGTTMIDRTLRSSSAGQILDSCGSSVASGMNTVCPDSKARFSSRVAIEIDDEIAQRRIFVRRHQAGFRGDFAREVDRAAIQSEHVAGGCCDGGSSKGIDL